jgi:hypothetical protein
MVHNYPTLAISVLADFLIQRKVLGSRLRYIAIVRVAAPAGGGSRPAPPTEVAYYITIPRQQSGPKPTPPLIPT